MITAVGLFFWPGYRYTINSIFPQQAIQRSHHQIFLQEGFSKICAKVEFLRLVYLKSGIVRSGGRLPELP